MLSKLNTIIRNFEKFSLAYGIIGLAVITVGNVISRRVFNYSWSFAEEVSQFILVLITFMGVSYAARKGRHIRMSAIYDLTNEKTKKILILIMSALTSIVLLYLAYYAALFVLQAKMYGRVTPALMVPFYLVIAWVPVGLFLGGVQYFLTLIKNITHKEVWLSFEEKSEYREL